MKRYQLRISAADAGKTLVDAVSEGAAISKKKAKALLDERNVFVNQRRVWMAKHNLHKGDVVEFQVAAPPAKEQRTIHILFEDDSFVAAAKPAGMLSNGDNSLETILRKQTGYSGLRAVHRIDQDTTGALLFAKSRKVMDQMIEIFKDRQIEKVYDVIVVGRFEKKSTAITTPLDNKPSRTEVKCLHAGTAASYLRCTIKTGRTHQIRKHLLNAGHPVLGDKRYGTSKDVGDAFRRVRRQMLHASVIKFQHPVTGQLMICEAPLPKDFKEAMRRLRLS